MILIADSGATKTDWIGVDDKKNIVFETKTAGLNPETIDKETIIKRVLENNLLVDCSISVAAVYAYVAGLGTEDKKQEVQGVLSEIFPKAKINALEDMYAAVYATAELGKPAIIGIIGTGSNCCLWNGQMVMQPVISLGYSVMDEASGNYIGKKLLSDYFFRKMPNEIKYLFEQKYNLSPEHIKHKLYREDYPNKYLAEFAPFAIENKKHPYISKLLKDGFQKYVDNWINVFKEYRNLPIHFVGSIAHFAKEELAEVLTDNSLIIGKIVQKPITQLVKYHTKDNNL